MQNTPSLNRQALGCGYLPRTDLVQIQPWQPPSGKRGYSGPELTTCAGYTTKLPEVTETAVALAHWKVGAVVAACDGEMPGEDLLNAILVLNGEANCLESWAMTPSKDGGGGV